MFSNKNEGGNKPRNRLKISVIAVLLLGIYVGASSLETVGATNRVFSASSNNSVTGANFGSVVKTVVSSTMAAGVRDELTEIELDGNAIILEKYRELFNSDDSGEDPLVASDMEISAKLEELKMDIYPAVNFKTYKASTTTTTKATTTTKKNTTTTTKKSTTSTTVSNSSSVSVNSEISGSEEQMAAWNYLVSQTSKVTSEVAQHVLAVKEFKEPYVLTDSQREIIEKAVMAEIGSEPYVSVVAIAQCLRESAEYENLDPVTILTKYKWTKTRIAPNQKVKDAVKAVFDYGIRVTNEKIMYFYCPSLTSSRGHETMFRFVFQIKGIRYFAKK